MTATTKLLMLAALAGVAWFVLAPTKAPTNTEAEAVEAPCSLKDLGDFGEGFSKDPLNCLRDAALGAQGGVTAYSQAWLSWTDNTPSLVAHGLPAPGAEKEDVVPHTAMSTTTVTVRHLAPDGSKVHEEQVAMGAAGLIQVTYRDHQGDDALVFLIGGSEVYRATV